MINRIIARIPSRIKKVVKFLTILAVVIFSLTVVHKYPALMAIYTMGIFFLGVVTGEKWVLGRATRFNRFK